MKKKVTLTLLIDECETHYDAMLLVHRVINNAVSTEPRLSPEWKICAVLDVDSDIEYFAPVPENTRRIV